MNRRYLTRACICSVLIFSFLLSGIFGTGTGYAQTTQDKIEEVVGEIAVYERELQKTQDFLAGLEGEKTDLLYVLDELDGELDALNEDLTSIGSRIAEKQEELGEARRACAQAKTERELQYEHMKLRIRYMYETGERDYLEMIFSADSISKILQELEYVIELAAYDKRMMDTYRESEKELVRTTEVLEEQEGELFALLEESDAKKASLELIADAKRGEIEKLEARIEDGSKELSDVKDRLQATMNEKLDLDSRLENEMAEAARLAAELAAKAAEEAARKAEEAKRLEEERRRQEEAAAQQNAAAQNSEAGNSTSSGQESQTAPGTTAPESTTPEATAPAPGTEQYDFVLTWPVPSSRRITSYYGPRPVPPVAGANPFHSAIDIAAPEGDPILAAADGVVIVSGDGEERGTSSGGWQVWLAHDGGRFMTTYMHCSKLLVEVGQEVKAGDVIALIGSTGASTGNHLDFRIIDADGYLDPLGSRVTYIN